MHFYYPISSIHSTDDYFRAHPIGGTYPLGRSGTWHGGAHLEGDEMVRSISDGEIIAYRFDNEYLSAPKTTNDPRPTYYSRNFILLKHHFSYSDKNNPLDQKEFIFYSLYMHLLPISEIVRQKRTIPSFFQSPDHADRWDETRFPLNGIGNCNIKIPAGTELGYTGFCGVNKIANYKVCHFEIFSFDINTIHNLLSANIKYDTLLKSHIQLLKPAALQQYPPRKIKGSWSVQVLEQKNGFSKIKIVKKKRVIFKKDIIFDAQTNSYAVPETAFKRVNNKFDGMLWNNNRLQLQEELPKDGSNRERLLLWIDYKDHPSSFWIDSHLLMHRKKDPKDNTIELPKRVLEQMFSSVENHIDKKFNFAAGYMIPFQRKAEQEDTFWYFIKYHDRWLRIKENDDLFQTVSSWDWHRWGFHIVDRNTIDWFPDQFIYSGHEEFLKKYIAQLRDEEGSLYSQYVGGDPFSADEKMKLMMKDSTIARQFMGMIATHYTEWAGEATANYFISELDTIIEFYAKYEDPEMRKTILDAKEPHLDSLQKKFLDYGFWDQVPELKGNYLPYHFHPVYFVEQMQRMTLYKNGDQGEVVRQINLRLSGFGGTAPSEYFTDRTEQCVRQFQRDYMKMALPTGVVDLETLAAMKTFSKKYREPLEAYTCRCNKCNSWGKSHGIHPALLWTVSALRFYMAQKLDSKFKINEIIGFRCPDYENEGKHFSPKYQGGAIALHLKTWGKEISSPSDWDEIERKLLPLSGCKSSKNEHFTEDEIVQYAIKTLNNRKWIEISIRHFDPDRDGEKEFWVHFDNEAYFKDNLI